MDAAHIVAHIMACAVKELEGAIVELVGDEGELYGAEWKLWSGMLRVGKVILEQWLRWRGQRPYEVSCCGCGKRMRSQQRRTRVLVTMFGEVRFWRRRYHCFRCHQWAHPADRGLGLSRRSITKALREVLALLGVQQAYAKAQTHVEKWLQQKVPLTTLYEQVRHVGEEVCLKEDLERKLVERHAKKIGSVAQAPNRLYTGMDGVKVRVGGDWHEVRVGVLFAGSPKSDEQGRLPDLVDAKTVLARYEEAAPFVSRYAHQVVRAGGLRAGELVCVSDAAPWIGPPLQSYFPRIKRIVDWYHAVEHLSAISTYVFGEGSERGARWLKKKKDLLWKGKLSRLLIQLQSLRPKHPQLAPHIGYFERHQAYMDYPRYRAAGMHVSSGVLESTCKQLVTQRCKGAGMRWGDGLNPILALRSHWLSDSWERAVVPML